MLIGQHHMASKVSQFFWVPHFDMPTQAIALFCLELRFALFPQDLAPRSLGVSAPENLLEHLHCGAAGVPFFPVMESPPALESPVWWWVKLCVLLVYVVSVLAKELGETWSHTHTKRPIFLRFSFEGNWKGCFPKQRSPAHGPNLRTALKS